MQYNYIENRPNLSEEQKKEEEEKAAIRRANLLLALDYHLEAKRLFYEANITQHNVTSYAPVITGVEDGEEKSVTDARYQLPEQVAFRGWWLTDWFVPKDISQWWEHRKTCGIKPNVLKDENIENIYWIEDYAPTTGGRHVHAVIILRKARERWQLLGRIGTGIDCEPLQYKEDELRVFKYMEKKKTKLWRWRQGYVHKPLPLTRYDRFARTYVKSVPEDTRNNNVGILDLDRDEML